MPHLKFKSEHSFKSHVKDAIVLNNQRWLYYRDQLVSRGDLHLLKHLNTTFKKLILSERMTLGFAWYYDWRAPIGMTYSFEEIQLQDLPDANPAQALWVPPIYEWTKQIQSHCLANSPDIVFTLVSNYLDLISNHRHNCMLRHLLESLKRSIWVLHSSHLPDSERSVYKHFVYGHTYFLKFGLELDQLAFPLQKMGYGLLAQELPNIPMIPKIVLDGPQK